jgi:hypothetical protein
MDRTIFVTKIRNAAQKQAARLLVESIRTFGGEMSSGPMWVFNLDPQGTTCQELENLSVQIIPLVVPEFLLQYDFGDKVYACACAEERVPAGVHSLVWIDLSCLVVNPPVLYKLGSALDVAVRPVHIQNVGLLTADPLDAYWKKVYQSVGVEEIETEVMSFVDGRQLRAYFNTHAFATNPAKGLLRRWLACFEELVCNQEFQKGACQDKLHQIFLHQAILSALIAASFDPERVRILPSEYNYPYNLHSSLSPERRAKVLNDLVSFTYEDRLLKPDSMDDIEIYEPLRSWLFRDI